jgi:hypothetical protein
MAELVKMKTVYKIYANRFEGEPSLLAIVDGEEVIGAEGKNVDHIKANLIRHGWPKVFPIELYNNGFVITHVEKVPAGL